MWLQYLSDNADAVASGVPAPHIAPETFFQWFVSIGGSGATMGLVIAGFLVGRARYTKSIMRAVAVPALFNISEPIMFGLPVMMNPFFIIPFLLAPLVLCVVTWFAFSWGFVTYMAVQPPWTLPAPNRRVFDDGRRLACHRFMPCKYINFYCYLLSIYEDV